MALSNTKIDICNRALVRIGAGTISSFDDTTAESVAANLLYDSVKSQLLSGHPWSFATHSVALDLINETPDSAFSNKWQLPSDWLRTVAVRANGVNITSFRIYGNTLHIDASDGVVIDYVRNVGETMFSLPFIQTLEYELASEFGACITHKSTLADHYRKLADRQLSRAKLMDSQQNGAQGLDTTDFPSARL